MLHQNEIFYIVLLLLLLITFKNGRIVTAQSSIGRQEYGQNDDESGRDDGIVGDSGRSGNGEEMAPRAPAISSHEPSCEELRAMWRFSKRQSRAAEITNEIPTYRDPFAYNVWDLYYPTTRSVGGMRADSRYKDPTRPVYGRILHKEPIVRFRDIPERYRTFDGVSRMYTDSKQMETNRNRPKFRFSGSSSIANPNNLLTPQRGSFQRLKELIWTERARELAQQRKAEEMAARAAVLKEITNGQGLISNGYSRQQQNQQLNQLQPGLTSFINPQEDDFKSIKNLRDSSDMLPFPDLLTPATQKTNKNGILGMYNDQSYLDSQNDNTKNIYSKYNNANVISMLEQQPQQMLPAYIRPPQQSHFRERNRHVASARHVSF